MVIRHGMNRHEGKFGRLPGRQKTAKRNTLHGKTHSDLPPNALKDAAHQPLTKLFQWK